MLLCHVYRSDVWWTTDALSWRQLTGTAPWGSRGGPTGASVRGLLVLVGGYVSSYVNDIWHSRDGITWWQVTDAAPFIPNIPSMLVNVGDVLWMQTGQSSTPNNHMSHAPHTGPSVRECPERGTIRSACEHESTRHPNAATHDTRMFCASYPDGV